MAAHPAGGDKGAGSNAGHADDRHEKDGDAVQAAPKSKLKVIGHYILLGLTPVISLAALGVAVFAMMGAHSGESQLSKSAAKVESINASLAATKAELDKLKLSLAHEKSVQENAQEEDRKKQEKLLAKIVQNITPLQVKLKISPTLEAQLRQEGASSAVLPASSAPTPTVAASKAVVPSKPVVPDTHTPAKSHGTSSSSGASTAPTPHEKKPGPQGRVLKDAIDKFNKK
jgi:hypothetical protein